MFVCTVNYAQKLTVVFTVPAWQRAGLRHGSSLVFGWQTFVIYA